MKKTLAIVLALAMVLCMIPVSFAQTTYTATIDGNQYRIDVAILDYDAGKLTMDWLGSKDDVNSYTAHYNYEDLDKITTGKWDEARRMALVTVRGFSAEFASAKDVEVTIDGRPVEVNKRADYSESVGWEGFGTTNQELVFPVELTKEGYTGTYLIEVTGTIEETNGDEKVLTEIAKITLKMVNDSEYKNGKTATISKIETNSNQLDAYVVGSRFYLDFASNNPSGQSKEKITITYKDNNGKLFDTATWAYTNDTFAAVIDGFAQDWTDGIRDGMQLDDSAATYVVRNCATADGDKVTFKLENGSAIYETKEYTVVVRTGIIENDPKGIYFAESSKTIKIGEEYTPVVYGVETNKKVDAKIEIGTRNGGVAVNAQYVDIIDNETVIGTQEGVAYITASYTTNDNKTYEASSMKITVTAQGATDDDDDDKDGKTYMVTASSLRVRSGAGTNFSQIGSLKNGATVKVESIANGWAKLENGGYVSAQYLAEVVDNGEAQTMYVTARTLNVRKGPGTSYAKVGTLSRGTAVQVVGFSGNWAKLSNGYYVSTSYLAK